MSGKLIVPNSNARHLRVVILAVLSVMASMLLAAAPAQADACSTGNAIACENSKPGSPASEWDVGGAGYDTIQGFATDISVNAGGTVKFKIKAASAYTVTIYRLGWYDGAGARKQAPPMTVNTVATQPTCVTDAATLNFDCGNWSVSTQWAVPNEAVSGVYIAKLEQIGNGDESHIPFIVRNDASHSDVVYQTSDPTWQAYNQYGGSDFYDGTDRLSASQPRAFKISYNRPFATRGANAGRDFLFSNEYPTIRFLERNGYDLSYISGLDTDRAGALLKNHKVFLSVGHDEYWSAQQRANVEAARDAGVNLMFLSGNEVYWRTRWEPSIDGTNTPDRTLVCYKATWDNASTDPTGQWTGTWRDPRYTPPATGGNNPENALTGTAYMSNFSDLPIQVSGAEGKLRLWRGTTLGSVADSTVTSLAPHTVGYESNEDLDNGFRPAGLVRLSTTTGDVPQYLQDFGNTVAPGNTTHHLTLYRATSGALVFSAGTIQWGWGLDEMHDGTTSPADSRMQQATVNMLADMHAQPTTLMNGLVSAGASTDTTAPITTIVSPSSGASWANGSLVTVTGTATDVGGRVAGVEVSLDGGTSWHAAAGRGSWSYTSVLKGTGPLSVKARSTDDSGNMESGGASVSLTASCPCSMFGAATPKNVDAADANPYELGMRFTSDLDGWVTGVRFYKSLANTGTHTGTLWTASGTLLATGTFTNETASGWQALAFPAPVQITKDTPYVVSYFTPTGHYSLAQDYFFAGNLAASPLRATSGQTTANGVYATTHAFPTQTYKSSNYYVDVLFNDRDVYPPAVVSSTPVAGASSVPASVTPQAVLSDPVQPGSVSFTLKDAANDAVSGTTSYSSASRTVTFTPSTPLARGITYTAAVSATDLAGNAMPAPGTWTFKTQMPSPTPGVCPCSVWDDTAVPAVISVDEATTSLTLGTKFTTDSDGVITGLRFYKGPRNMGPHVGSLWSSTGQLLASATFTSESSTGWQAASFSQPVSVAAGATYVVGYNTTTGYYSATWGMFATAGVDNSPVQITRRGGGFLYGSNGYPSYQSDANYWVDPVFTIPAGTVPTVGSTSPQAGTTSVQSSASVTATFSIPVQPASVQLSLSSSAGAVAGSVTMDATRRVATFRPSAALAAGTNYIASASATSAGGTAMSSPTTWTFRTNGATVCPCTLFPSTATPGTADAGESSAVVLGMRFTASSAGYISGARFYKSPLNTGTHSASLWSASGIRLAQATFTGESASGWQTVAFPQGVQLTPGATYVISYFAPNGHYSFDSRFFDTAFVNEPLNAPAAGNGVFVYGSDRFPTASYNNTNYWVDPIFSTGTAPDTTPPSVVTKSPASGATRVALDTPVSAQFSEPVSAASVMLTVKDASNAAVAGSVIYVAATRTVTFTPAGLLAQGAAYTASASAMDSAGNAMTIPSSWSFTTTAPRACPCSIWADTDEPATLTVQDPQGSSELGMKFTADANGSVTGVKFYKGPQNTGPHTGTLWSAAGQQLATVAFANETASGWQTASFAQPVTVTAGTTYVVSYHNNATWSVSRNQFSVTGVDNEPLHVPASGGVFAYSSGGVFPGNSSNSNYWVDVIFTRSG